MHRLPLGFSNKTSQSLKRLQRPSKSWNSPKCPETSWNFWEQDQPRFSQNDVYVIGQGCLNPLQRLDMILLIIFFPQYFWLAVGVLATLPLIFFKLDSEFSQFLRVAIHSFVAAFQAFKPVPTPNDSQFDALFVQVCSCPNQSLF